MSKDGSIAVFYGYKGGSGRSFMLANVAHMLATRKGTSAKKSVLVVDADLEAPGVGDFFANLAPGPFIRKWRESSGLLELLWRFREDHLVEDLRTALESADFFNARPITDGASDEKSAYLHRLWAAEHDAGAYLHFLGPGQVRGEVEGPSYTETIIDADWAEFYRYGGERFFHSFGLILRERYDHVLFDLRTGFSSGAVRAAAVLADKLVMFATPALQSIIGLRDMYFWLRQECEKACQEGLRDAPELPAMAVMTRVERPAAPDAQAVGEHRIAVGNAGVEPSGAARDPEDLFHVAFAFCEKRPVIQHVSGLQVEQLMRPKSATPGRAGRELIAKIGEVAAWLANEDSSDSSEFSDIAVDHAAMNESPKDEFDKLTARMRATELIEGALRLDVKAGYTPNEFQRREVNSDQRKESLRDQEDKATRKQQEDALREKYGTLKLHAVFLFELLVSLHPKHEREFLEILFGLSPSSPSMISDKAGLGLNGRRVPVPRHRRRRKASPRLPGHQERRQRTPPDESFDLPWTFDDFRPYCNNLSGRIDRLLSELETTSERADAHASAAYRLLANSALRDDRNGFDRGASELDRMVERTLRMDDDGPVRALLGFQIVWAAHTLRNLGGDWFDIAERWFGQGWRLGALFSSGKPPPFAEANGIVSYAFLFGAMGRIKIAKTTLEQLYEATREAPEHEFVHRNHCWWDAVLRMEGVEVASGAADIAKAASGASEIGQAPEEFGPGYDLWRARALRWRGDIEGARECLHKLRNPRRPVSPGDASPRLTRLAELALAAQIYQSAGDIEALAESLAMAVDWAKPRSALFESVIAAHRASTSLCMALIRREQTDAALAAASAALGDGKPAAARLANRSSDDLRWRQPALVRAALTAVRQRHDSAKYWLDLCAKAFVSSPSTLPDSWTCVRRNMWSAEQFYLLARARDAHDRTDTAPAALNNALELIGNKDRQVAEAASVMLRRLGDLWLNGFA